MLHMAQSSVPHSHRLIGAVRFQWGPARGIVRNNRFNRVASFFLLSLPLNLNILY